MAQRTADIERIEATEAAFGDGLSEAAPELEAVRAETPAPVQPCGATPTVWLFSRGEAPCRIDADPDDLGRLVADDANFVWIDLEGYGAADLERLAGPLALPEPAVRTALAGWQRPRFDAYGDNAFVAVTVPALDADAYAVMAGELDLFVGRNALVSAHKHPVPFADSVVARAQQGGELLREDSALLLAILLEEVLLHYDRLTEGLEDEVEALEERALADDADSFLADLLALKRYVFAVSRLAEQHRPVFAAFLRPDVPFAKGEAVQPYFRDLNERLARLLDGSAAVKDGVNGAFDIYVSQVAHHTNNTMKLLTMVSTVLLPATVILGFFGTNFDAPRLTTFGGFVAMVASIVLVTALVLVSFARRGWLRAPRGTTSGALATVTPKNQSMPPDQ